jgi:uncharacterized protein YkwD
MSQARSPWILTLLFFAAASTVAAQEAPSGPISRFFQRDQQPAVHHHHHVHTHAQPSAVALADAPAYDYTYAQVQPAEARYVQVQPTEAEFVAPPAEMVVQQVAYEPAPVQYVEQPVEYAAPTPAPTAAPTQPYAYQTGGDPYGFTNVLNRLRAAAGLHPLAYDPSLSSWAQQNNAEQCRRGLGHHVNPFGTQNCAYNYSDANSAATGWMNSPGHRDNMLSPTATSFGIAFGPGPYWTMNAR